MRKMTVELTDEEHPSFQSKANNCRYGKRKSMFQEAVRAFITPMILTLSIMTLADDGSEFEVLG